MCYAESPTVQDANTRSHQLYWGDPEMGTAISCTRHNQLHHLFPHTCTHMHTCIFSTYKLFTMETILATAFGRVIDIQRGEADELTKASASISELAREGADTLDLILVLLSEFCFVKKFYSLSYVHILGITNHYIDF